MKKKEIYQLKLIRMVVGEEIAKGQEGAFWSDRNILYTYIYVCVYFKVIDNI